MRKFWIVFAQVYKKNVRSGSWLFLVIAPVIFAVIIGYFGMQTVQPAKVAVVAPQSLQTAIVRTSAKGVHFQTATSDAAAKQQLAHEQVDGVLTVAAAASGHATFVERSNASTSVDAATLTTALSQVKTQRTAASLHLNANQLRALVAPAQVTKRTVQVKNGTLVTKDSSKAGANAVIAGVVPVFVLLITMIYGSMLAQEIATEKGTRIMEILLSSVSATTQFFGKLAGMFALLLTQIAAYVVVGGISWFWLRDQPVVRTMLRQVNLSVLWSRTALIAGLFFVIGVLTFAVLAALTGSLVSNQEQVSTAVMPISMIGLAGYLLSFMAQTGDSSLLHITSYIPFLSINVMPVQLALGHVGFASAVVSLIVQFLFLIVFTWLVVGIYGSNVLVYSDANFMHRLRTSLAIWRSER